MSKNKKSGSNKDKVNTSTKRTDVSNVQDKNNKNRDK